MRGRERARRVFARIATIAGRPAAPDGYDDPVVRFLFDAAYYGAQRPTRLRDPLAHYLRDGWSAGLDPHPLFSTTSYLDDNPDVAASGLCPLVHYARFGAQEGRRPHQLFDPLYYRDRYLDVSDPSIDPLVHFLSFGGGERRDPNPWFDTGFYVASAPQVTATGLNPLQHYATVGWREGRNPHPDFDVAFYRATNPDLGERDPLTHFLTVGLDAGREPCADFGLRLLAHRHRDAPVGPCRLVVLADDADDPTGLLARCPMVVVQSPADYEPKPRAGDYVYAPDRPAAALCGAHLIHVALCLAHQCYDFVVVTHDRANGSVISAASPANAVVVSADLYERWRVGSSLPVGSAGRFLRLGPAPPGELAAIPLDRIGLGAIARFGADLVVAGRGTVLPPIVARRSPAGVVMSGSPALQIDVAELGPPEVHDAIRRATDGWP